jgi:hypothetical protein
MSLAVFIWNIIPQLKASFFASISNSSHNYLPRFSTQSNPFRTISSLSQYGQQIVTVTMMGSPFIITPPDILPHHPLGTTHYPFLRGVGLRMACR